MNQPKRRGRPPRIKPVTEEFGHEHGVADNIPNSHDVLVPGDESASYAVIAPVMLERVPEAKPIITWSEFASFIRNSGAVVKASYPAPQFDVIQTIWCGVPVIVGEPAVMDKHQNWTKL